MTTTHKFPSLVEFALGGQVDVPVDVQPTGGKLGLEPVSRSGNHQAGGVFPDGDLGFDHVDDGLNVLGQVAGIDVVHQLDIFVQVGQKTGKLKRKLRVEAA